MASSNKAKHHEARKLACYYLARFGYLRSEDLAQLLYPGKASALRMAQQLTQTMTEEGLLLRHQPDAATKAHFAISEAGARIARALTGTSYKSGKDLIRDPSGHRDAANTVAVQALRQGLDVRTEREVQTSAGRELGGKVPDCLLIDEWTDECGGVVRDYVWVEVEHSVRGGRDLQALARWILRVAFPDKQFGTAQPYRDGQLAAVLLVVAKREAHTIRGRVVREMERQVTTAEEVRWVREWAPERVKVLNLVAGEEFKREATGEG